MSLPTGDKTADNLRTGILIILLGVLLFAGVDTLNKILGQTLTIVQILWVRFLIFVPIAMALAYRRQGGIVWRTQRPVLQGVRAVLLVVEMGFFVAALKYLPLADVQAIAASAPLMVIALSVPFLGEQVGWRRWSAVGVGFVGVLIIVRPGFESMGMGTILALIGTALWAIYQIMLRIVGRYDPAPTTALWTAVIGLAMTSVFVPFQWNQPDMAGWVMLVAIALLGAAGHTVFMKAFTLAPASALQPFTYTQLVLVTFFGYIVFDDLPDQWTVAGASLIVCAGLYSIYRARIRAAGSA
ncbi:MAG: DMT family transporter [Alphaproteobacteria bacterium]|nr:DMT family transporter [Alphaproteobacteria bacterium]MBU0799192.1 DMT family transporter [Alphaproteobacteria bacterium]MBU0887557.1 DMT family transporter [Alphaproteobacteria bacterium]MBU1814794.1 DMT family transporter [Alphaproteobacteria bacterium]MBU2091170.1 DMT family transporter [Alphaproteobacteria bacterium]